VINKETLTEEWIATVSRDNRRVDKILVEKVIRAMLLVEELAKSGLSFIFKGGTSLMLLLDNVRRLSIDVDIVLAARPDRLEDILNSFVKDQGFSRAQEQKRNVKSQIEKAHFRFFYDPVHRTSASEDYVLLDVLFESHSYRSILQRKIESKFLNTSPEVVLVSVPSPENLLGDKLTAFAPGTTGVPYFKSGKSMSMEIMKQLYDIGTLFDVSTDLETIRSTFYKTAETEIGYRGLKGTTPADVLEDAYQTSLCLALRGADGKGNFIELQHGIERVSSFVFSENYHIERAILDAAKIAYLCRLIPGHEKNIETFSGVGQIAEGVIAAPHNTKLNKLKKSNPAAFFYWWKAISL
jgi:hypothetical protein